MRTTADPRAIGESFNIGNARVIVPIVVADQSTLGQALADLLIDGQRRHDLGIRGRHHVETHQDARRIASNLVSIYQDMLRRQAGAVRKR